MIRGAETGLWPDTREENSYLRSLSDLVQCYVRGIWDKDLFYKAVFEFLGIGSLLSPISLVEQKGAVAGRDARPGGSGSVFWPGKNKTGGREIPF